MAQITEAQRVQRIRDLVRELNKVPPEKHEVVRLPGVGGEPLLCQVIKMRVDEVLLNHRSHRIRAQLQDDPEWSAVESDPFSEHAQEILERHVEAARSPEEFEALKESLQREGQVDPGVMTHLGVLINANTRVVALRQLDDPDRHVVRVAVLPDTALVEDLSLLELRLQMQKELKVDYTLTNELLFIEELSIRRHMSDAQIARELRIHPESTKKGEAEVRLRLRMLDLLRQLQTIPSRRLPLTFFDSLSYEQLRDLHRSYHGLVETDPSLAQQHLENFLLSVSVGVTTVHQLRRVDSDFMADYMLTQLEEDEGVGRFAAELVGPSSGDSTPPKGVAGLLTDDAVGDPKTVDVKSLIDVVTQHGRRVNLDRGLVLDRDEVADAVKSAIVTGIKEKRREEGTVDKLQAPVEALRAAVRQVERCSESLAHAVNDPQFTDARRKSLEAAFRKLRRTFRHLEGELARSNVVSDRE